MRDRHPYRLGLALLLVALSSAAALGASQPPPALQTPEPSPTFFQRPVLTLISYSASGAVSPGDNFTMTFRVANQGGAKARNIVFTIVPGDFLPSGSGGVIAGGVIVPEADTGYTQGLIATGELALKSIGTLQISASYTDDFGSSYSETFNLTFPVTKKTASSGSVRPTVTPTPAPRPILLIDGYQVDVDPLRPGAIFNLEVRVANVGGSLARSVTEIIGGGMVSGDSGTPGANPGGVSATGGLENFAPLGQSNVAYLGDLPPAAQLTSIHALIVNSTTTPGAYPLRISLIYSDGAGRVYTDDQTITLLVYAPPMLEIGFYQAPDPLLVGQPGSLPIQVLNLDRKPAVLSRVRVASDGAEILNGELPIGYLDTGLSFTIDAQVMPFQPGPLDIVVSVDYVDDFNEQQVIQQTLTLGVIEAEPIPEDFGGGGGIVVEPEVSQPESFWDQVLRFLRGLLGLDSAPAESAPIEEFPSEGPIQIVPGAPGTKG